jgi:hypothetical protein
MVLMAWLSWRSPDRLRRWRLVCPDEAGIGAWGHRRIQGELARLGHKIAKTTVWQILTDNSIEPSPNRSDVIWTEFLHSQAAVACDFFTVDTCAARKVARGC